MRKRRNYYTKMLSSSTFRMIRIGGSVTSRKCYDKLAGKAMTQTRSYHDNVIDHYENPRNVGSMDKKKKNVGTGLVGAPACGDVMKLQFEVDENDKVVNACFKTFGCGSAIASSSYATEIIKGKSLDEIQTITNSEIAQHLKLPPVKLHCSMLAEDAIKAAVKDYKQKQST